MNNLLTLQVATGSKYVAGSSETRQLLIWGLRDHDK